MYATRSTSEASVDTASLTVLNSMAGDDIAAALDRHLDWGLELLDLKDRIFGKAVADLAPDDGERLRFLAEQRGLRVHTLSTTIGGSDAAPGEDAFRAAHEGQIARVLRLIPILQPVQVRLLAAQHARRSELCDAIAFLRRDTPWLFAWYRETVDRIEAAGAVAVIENEVGGTCMGRPEEIVDFFAALERPRARLIWDVANLWQMGTFPSVDVYRRLRPLIAMLHLKGGRAEVPGGRLRWKSTLAEASWPVRDIVGAALADRSSPVICLNPPHGEPHDGYRFQYDQDLRFLRQTFREIR